MMRSRRLSPARRTCVRIESSDRAIGAMHSGFAARARIAIGESVQHAHAPTRRAARLRERTAGDGDDDELATAANITCQRGAYLPLARITSREPCRHRAHEIQIQRFLRAEHRLEQPALDLVLDVADSKRADALRLCARRASQRSPLSCTPMPAMPAAAPR